ncbi:MAG: hypothetical protein HFF83_03885 [Oscillibacter sp.]|jgi:hypothetical protein|nr:hypothetical protein [Oscillibacter sp.]
MRLIHWLLHFIFSCVPGCGQMYQGYMKRGLSQCVMFFLGCGVVIFLQAEALMTLLAPLWLYTFFDSYNLRRCLREGYGPEDSYLFGLSDWDSHRLAELLNRRHSFLGWALVVMGVYSLYQLTARRLFSFLFRDFLPWMEWLYDLLVWDMPRILGSVLILGLGLWFIRGPKVHIEDDEPYTPPSSSEPPPKMDPTPWTEAEAKVHSQPEPQAPGAEPTPVTFQWKSEFEVEKFQENGEKEE